MSLRDGALRLRGRLERRVRDGLPGPTCFGDAMAADELRLRRAASTTHI